LYGLGDHASFANVARIFGLHDRPCAPRLIFGTLGYMNAGILDRVFDMAAYVRLMRSPPES
jgi:deoxyribodipyrimidine photo-lyase